MVCSVESQLRSMRCQLCGVCTYATSRQTAMPNVEYYAPWFRSEGIMRCMPYSQWEQLSPHAQRISRYVVCDEGEAVIGAGYMNPRRRAREAVKQKQLDAMGEKRAKEYLARL